MVKKEYMKHRPDGCPLVVASPILENIIKDLEEKKDVALYSSANATEVADCIFHEGVEEGLGMAIEILKGVVGNDTKG